MKSLSLTLMVFALLGPFPGPIPVPVNPPGISIQATNPPPYKIYMPAIATAPKGPVIANSIGEWVTVGEGVSYQQFTLSDPNNVYVARMDRADPNVFLESSIGTGELVGGRETVSGMAQRYDEALNHWNNTWGGRNHVVVAINGDYFEPSSGYPQNGMLQSGWYIKRYNDHEGWSGFAWLNDRSAFIGQCIVNDPSQQYVTFANSDKAQPIDALNAPRKDGKLVLYTPQYASSTLTDSSGSEVVVELTSPLALNYAPDRITGRVTAIRSNAGSTLIPYDSIVLSGQGKTGEDLIANVQIGDEIGITQQIGSFGGDCKTPIPGDWTQVYSAIGGAFTFLRDGEPQHMSEIGAVVRHPRTAIAMNDQYIYFIVVDGRSQASVGMTFDELASFSIDMLQATWGIAQDGGGSSTMVINGQVVNTPSDKCPVNSPNVVSGNPADQDLQPAPGATAAADLRSCERPVSNGMMIVDYEPMGQSTAFTPGSQVVTRYETPVYLGPGTNYGLIGTLPAGEMAVVNHDQNGLDGVEAKGTFWWEVTAGGTTGWVAESDISAP